MNLKFKWVHRTRFLFKFVQKRNLCKYGCLVDFYYIIFRTTGSHMKMIYKICWTTVPSGNEHSHWEERLILNTKNNNFNKHLSDKEYSVTLILKYSQSYNATLINRISHFDRLSRILKSKETSSCWYLDIFIFHKRPNWLRLCEQPFFHILKTSKSITSMV